MLYFAIAIIVIGVALLAYAVLAPRPGQGPAYQNGGGFPGRPPFERSTQGRSMPDRGGFVPEQAFMAGGSRLRPPVELPRGARPFPGGGYYSGESYGEADPYRYRDGRELASARGWQDQDPRQTYPSGGYPPEGYSDYPPGGYPPEGVAAQPYAAASAAYPASHAGLDRGEAQPRFRPSPLGRPVEAYEPADSAAPSSYASSVVEEMQAERARAHAGSVSTEHDPLPRPPIQPNVPPAPPRRPVAQAEPPVLRGPLVQGALFLDRSNSQLYDGRQFRAEDLDPLLFQDLKRVGTGSLQLVGGDFVFHVGDASYAYRHRQLARVVFYENGLALIPRDERTPVPIFLSQEAGAYKDFLKTLT